MSAKPDWTLGRIIREEVEVWEKEGLISLIQKERILARYRMKGQSEGAAGARKLITTLSVMGSTLAGVGVLLFVAANWSGVPVQGKLAILFASLAACYGIGYYLRFESGNYPRVGSSLILLGSLIFGAGIFLIAQIYHLSVHFPNGPLLWGVGVLPLAYLLRFKTLLFLSLLVLMLWLGLEASFRISKEPLAVWFDPSQGGKLVPVFFLVGLALWGLGLAHRGFRKWRALSGPFLILGPAATFVTGFLFTFDLLFGKELGSSSLWPFYLGLLFLFFLSCLAQGLSPEKEAGWLLEILFLLIMAGVGIYLTAFFSASPRGNHKDFVLAANIIFALTIFIVLLLGYRREISAYINIALLFFVLDLTVRYFDFFWKLLPRSLFFIIGGVVLLVGGVLLERKRRKILDSFHGEEEEA